MWVGGGGAGFLEKASPAGTRLYVNGCQLSAADFQQIGKICLKSEFLRIWVGKNYRRIRGGRGEIAER